jgi:hypothetical protein
VLEVEFVKFEQLSRDGLVRTALHRTREVLGLHKRATCLLEQKIEREQSEHREDNVQHLIGAEAPEPDELVNVPTRRCGLGDTPLSATGGPQIDRQYDRRVPWEREHHRPGNCASDY